MVDAYKAQSLASKSCYFKKRPIKKTIVTQLYINPPLIHGFAFWGFIYPRSTQVQKYEMESSRNKQFLSFKFYGFLSKCDEISHLPKPPHQGHEPSLCPTYHTFSHLVVTSVIRSPVTP